MSIDDGSAVHKWLKENGVVTLNDTAGVRSIVRYFLGEKSSKQWWGHPEGGKIHNAYMALASSDEVLTCKLVRGRVTLIHKALWPALFRVVTDSEWRRIKIESLNPGSQEILECIESMGTVSTEELSALFGKSKSVRKDRISLETKMMVAANEFHSSSGAHGLHLQSWFWLRDYKGVNDNELGLEEAFSEFSRRGISFP